MNKVYTAQEMREMANAVDDVSINYNGEYYYEKDDKFNPDLVRDMLRQAAEDKDAKDADGGGMKYEYAIQKKFSRTWQTVISDIYSLGATKADLLTLNTKNPDAERRIVRRPVGKWEVVE